MLSQGHLADKSFLSLSLMFLKSNVGKIAGGVELGSGWSGVICEGTIRQRGKDLVEWLVESFVSLEIMKFNPTTPPKLRTFFFFQYSI
jgi:hypothetical protein